MNKPMKFAKKELTKLGCVVEDENDRRIEFRLRDGSGWHCSNRTQMQTVRAVVARVRRGYRDETGECLAAFPDVTGAPRLDVGEYHAPSHFRDRLTLMRAQGLTASEVTGALLAPESVRYSEHTGRRIYCAGRIGVVVAPPEHGVHILITLLWATDALWEQNPRPEMEKL